MDFSRIGTERYKKINIDEYNMKHSKTLYRSICVPSLTHSFSICIEYIKNWFKDKFAPDTFKTEVLDGGTIFGEMSSLSRTELLKKPRPFLLISPSINWDFDNENIDLYQYGIDLYTTSGEFKESFLRDTENNVYLGIGYELLLMSFTFRVKLETRAQQLDMYKYMKLACKVGSTNGENVNLDFHIPYELMIQVARDLNFEVVSDKGIDKIKEPTPFIRYLNSHSSLPFIYKYRNVNGLNEFFLRLSDVYIHIRSMDISADDGDREGQLSNNFGIEWNCEVRFPCPKMYAYYSDNRHNLDVLYTASNLKVDPSILNRVHTIKITELPDHNDYKWHLYLTTTYENEEAVINKTPLEIDFKDLFEGDLLKVINESKNLMISPAMFIEIKIFNERDNRLKLMKYTMDWDNLILTTEKVPTSYNSLIGLYCDVDYLNNTLVRLSEI